MTYEELICRISIDAGVTEKQADAVIDALRAIIHEGEEVNIPKLGEIKPRKCAARSGTLNGVAWSKPAYMAAQFKPFKATREALAKLPVED